MSKKTELDNFILAIRAGIEVICQNELQNATTEQLLSELFNRNNDDVSCMLRLADKQANLLLSRLLERDLNDGMKNEILEYVFNKISVKEIINQIDNSILLETAIDRNTNYEILKALAENFSH